MNQKHTLLPIILALAIGGCSNTPQHYPNFQACYNDLGDANDCIQYIQENNTNTYSNTAPDGSVSPVQDIDNDSGIDGSSALTGAAVGAAAGYVAGSMNNNRNNYSDSERQRQDRVYAAGTNTTRPVNSGNNSNNKSTSNNNSNSKVNLSKLTPSKSSTNRGGFGATGSKSFGG